MINQPRPRRRSGIGVLATLMIAAWIGLVFVARFLADSNGMAGFGAFVGFFVIAMSVVTYALFMIAIDSDKA